MLGFVRTLCRYHPIYGKVGHRDRIDAKVGHQDPFMVSWVIYFWRYSPDLTMADQEASHLG